MEELLIEMPRGDLQLVHFEVIDEETGEVSTVDFTQIYFSVKKSIYDAGVLFQKTLSEGGIMKLGTGEYQIEILPEDTTDLGFGEYKFDIEFIFEDTVHKTIMGRLIIGPEITCAWNEG